MMHYNDISLGWKNINHWFGGWGRQSREPHTYLSNIVVTPGMIEASMINNYNLDNLYGHRFYLHPKREPWIPWFAWRPIQLLYWCDEAPFSSDHPIKLSKMLWLTTVLRRRVIDNHSGPGREFAPSFDYWEYTTVFDLFKWGSSE